MGGRDQPDTNVVRIRRSWLSSSPPCESCLRRGTAIALASAVVCIRSVVHNRSFGVDRGDRGMNCMWGVHKLPRPPARLPVGSFCMTAGGRQPRPGHQRRDLPAAEPFGGRSWIASSEKAIRAKRSVDGSRARYSPEDDVGTSPAGTWFRPGRARRRHDDQPHLPLCAAAAPAWRDRPAPSTSDARVCRGGRGSGRRGHTRASASSLARHRELGAAHEAAEKAGKGRKRPTSPVKPSGGSVTRNRK